MKTSHRRILLVLILSAAAIGLYFGWKLFWFLTDDAFIAFRYVSNSILGYGYTWNPPPFRPVEGYTSFLWVVLLDFIWRVFDIQPPEAANYLCLGFSYLTLGLVELAVMRLKLPPGLQRYRLIILILVLFGILTNRTFLAWTSSGMETAMFNFFFTLWIFTAARENVLNLGWMLTLTGSAALAYLSRPDGILTVLGSLVLLAVLTRRERKQKNLNKKHLLYTAPLLLVAGHLIFRKSFYGDWLPNTYYAKYVASWPEAGLRYFASFVLEYGLWVWFLVFFLFIFLRSKTTSAFFKVLEPPSKKIIHDKRGKEIQASKKPVPGTGWPLGTVIFVVVSHLAYYTLVIGGDHFEYRVYSFLVPLLFFSLVWMLTRLQFKPALTVSLLSLFMLFSLPIPWTHWALTKDLKTREETYMLQASISRHFPPFLRWYTESFDHLQSWLIRHHVCMRHQEHKIFYEHRKMLYPSRPEGEKIHDGSYPVLATAMVGVAGWVLPHVAIIDLYGLNDYVIARSPLRRKQEERLMAHDRLPPPGYVESFAPNLFLEGPKQMGYEKREQELTADYIIANEAYWFSQASR